MRSMTELTMQPQKPVNRRSKAIFLVLCILMTVMAAVAELLATDCN